MDKEWGAILLGDYCKDKTIDREFQGLDSFVRPERLPTVISWDVFG
jgi:hypothetical protein